MSESQINKIPYPPTPTKPNPISVLNDFTNKLSLNLSLNSKKSITKKNKLNSHTLPHTPIRTRRYSGTTLSNFQKENFEKIELFCA